jgi:hypothetical protein
MSRDPSVSHPSSFELDALAMRALAEEDRTRVERHLAECDVCRSASEVSARDRAHFTEAVFARSLPSLKQRLLWSRLFTPRARGVLWALPAAAAVALVAVWAFHGGDHPDLHPAIAAKGDPSFVLYVQKGTGVLPVTSGHEAVAPGDGVRFVVRPSGFSHLLIVSVDGAGHPSVYFPYEGRESAAIQDDGEITLPGSIVLDRTPGPERIFALFSQRPIQAAAVIAPLRDLGGRGADAIRRAERLSFPAEAQSSVLLENSGAPAPP